MKLKHKVRQAWQIHYEINKNIGQYDAVVDMYIINNPHNNLLIKPLSEFILMPNSSIFFCIELRKLDVPDHN